MIITVSLPSCCNATLRADQILTFKVLSRVDCYRGLIYHPATHTTVNIQPQLSDSTHPTDSRYISPSSRMSRALLLIKKNSKLSTIASQTAHAWREQGHKRHPGMAKLVDISTDEKNVLVTTKRRRSLVANPPM